MVQEMHMVGGSAPLSSSFGVEQSISERYVNSFGQGRSNAGLITNQHEGENAMNSDQLQGKWKQIKGSVKERWGKLTDDDINVIDGKHDQLVGKIQEKYGIAREAAQKQVDEWNAVESHQSDLEEHRKAS
jgi:uncharacterized protein YjbJ (UPF0337 family)